MPLYDYQCQQCHRHTEKIQKFSDPPLTECPHCGGRLERVVHAPAVAFKGSGWYADLYSSSKSGAKPEDSKTGDAKSSDGKADSSAKSAETASSSSKESSPSSGAGASASSAASSSAAASSPASNSGTK